MLRLILLLTIVPTIELFVLFIVGARLGAPLTFATILVTGILGARLARREGFEVLANVQHELAAGQTPTSTLLEGALVVMGGLLLLTPGFLTDALGFCLMHPATRGRVAASVGRAVKQRVHITTSGGAQQSPTSSTSPWASPFDDEPPSTPGERHE